MIVIITIFNVSLYRVFGGGNLFFVLFLRGECLLVEGLYGFNYSYYKTNNSYIIVWRNSNNFQTEQTLPLRVKVDLRVMAIRLLWTFHKWNLSTGCKLVIHKTLLFRKVTLIAQKTTLLVYFKSSRLGVKSVRMTDFPENINNKFTTFFFFNLQLITLSL